MFCETPSAEKSLKQYIDDKLSIILDSKEKHKSILVLSGGSLKGIAQLGAILCLERNDKLRYINTVSGSSVGSLIGMLFICGYKSLELFDFMKRLNIDAIKNFNPVNILNNYGLDDGERIILVIKKLMEAKGFDPVITFKKFYEKTNKDFIITGTCVNNKKTYYFSHASYPDMLVVDAIRISISIPLIFTPVKFEGMYFIDGACTTNYPIKQFNKMLDQLIGIYCMEKEQYVDINYIEDYFKNAINSMCDGYFKNEIIGTGNETIIINCTNVGKKIENLISMFEEGYAAAQLKIDEGHI